MTTILKKIHNFRLVNHRLKHSIPLPFFLVQSLNSPFFLPHIGAEPGRVKRESRITCMRMLRTNQSKITRSQPYYAARVSESRNAFFSSHSSRALKKRNIFFDVDIVEENKSKCGLWRSVLSLTTSTRHNSLPKHFFSLLRHVERRVCESFWKESLTRTSSSFE